MIIVDTALAKRVEENRPIKLAIIGAGFQASGTILQIAQAFPGIKVVGVAARRVQQGLDACEAAGLEACVEETENGVNDAISSGRTVVTPNHIALSRADGVECVMEMTGSIEYATEAILTAIEAGKHVVHMNAEVDGTLGPILKVKADKAGVIYSFSDGDQPGVQANLIRFVKGIGVNPVLSGNIKGLHDPYRNPTTQKPFAEKWGQKPAMVASFADGTKISYEQAIVANAFDMEVAQRGMLGPDFSGGDPTAPLVPLEDTLKAFEPHVGDGSKKIVDYVVGARPGPGVFVLGTHEHPRQKHYLNLYKLGQGPLYLFYTPYHLCHFEAPTSVARAVLFGDPTLTPSGAPKVGVIAQAKIDLKAGETIDEFGGYATYGVAENQSVIDQDNLLPIGLAVGAQLVRDVPKDAALTFDDVVFPEGRLIDKLYAEQRAYFAA